MVGSATVYFFSVERIARLLISAMLKSSQSVEPNVEFSAMSEPPSQ
jgi:hypothetical protein